MENVLSDNQKTNSVLILYPWGIDSVRNKDIGAGMRVGLLADFLREQGYSVTVASVGLRYRTMVHDGITYEEHRYPSNVMLLTLYALAITFVKIFDAHAVRALIYYDFPRLDRTFSSKIRSLARTYSHVLLEYPFWHSFVDEEKTILTNHDIATESWGGVNRKPFSRLLRSMLMRREIAAMRKFRKTVIVSESDSVFFTAQGLPKPWVIPNPIRMPDVVPDLHGDLSDTSKTLTAKALFVGGGWYPNVQAAKAIAEQIAPRCPDVQFILAGESSRHIRPKSPNISCLGPISRSMLERCYREATYSLVPLAVGTGTSVKTIEALSYGKVIIATAVGVRGISFENDVHGIVCDDVRMFPEILHLLEADCLRRETFSRNALQLARRYDYRSVFKRYLDIMRDGNAQRGGTGYETR